MDIDEVPVRQSVATPEKAAAVSFRGASKTYANGHLALAPVDLVVGQGEIVSVVGPSGCGKSTLLRLAAGLTGASAGRVERDARHVAVVFQDPTLLPWLTVSSNVQLVSRIRKVPRAERRRTAAAAIETVGLSEFARSLPRELSGGMRMRVSLARALTSNPDLMLMDEPFAALDEFTRARLGDQLIDLWRRRGFSVMFVTHSIAEAVRLAHRIVVMSPGPGKVDTVIDSPSPPSIDPHAVRDEAALDAASHRIAHLLGER